MTPAEVSHILDVMAVAALFGLFLFLVVLLFVICLASAPAERNREFYIERRKALRGWDLG